MEFIFTKMEGAGNDFIFCTGKRGNLLPRGKEIVAKLCDRRRGIGADGLIVVTPLPEKDMLKMDYFNADGSPADMCGNGLRCAMEYACLERLSGDSAEFRTGAGILRAWRRSPGIIRIEMPTPSLFIRRNVCGFECYFTKVGVPHAVVPVRDLNGFDVREKGRLLRTASEFSPEGANIDFVEEAGMDFLKIRTYERGVEDETLACGTGVTAAAAYLETFRSETGKEKIIKTRGNDLLTVEFGKECNILKKAFLTGPAKAVFTGRFYDTTVKDFDLV